ncbi:group 1 glycosyl transferase [Tolypothrix sp. NIES-4075]|uniref:glycosyltransferase family 4 protein n=1 Tax=Tolypothrix sp. NIES-4075 TaxID=2005459 RepID=UPI000B5CA624|nr:glycosyltransferase family 4 protein [Tolypothrix sp. NIES-4075]GAX39161.1 group 1 glycosyl transferase [Tolypothrix sp. NIES-4075]
MKILHLITSITMGGAQDNTLLTLEKHNRSYEVHLASNPNGFWQERAKKAADVFHPLPNLVNPLNPLKDIATLIETVRLLRQEKFDLIHTHSSKAGILGRCSGKIVGIPVIHTIHGFPFHDFMPKWKRQFYINIERSVRPFTDFFITVSELNRQEAANLNILNLDNSQTVYSGIDFTKLDRPFNLQDTRHTLEIPEGWQTISMVGRLDEQKAPYFLIDAFAKVLEHNPNTLLLLVGDGKLLNSLKSQVQQLGIEDKVRFLGSREDVPEILKVSDVFALSSLWEGLGRAMTEAMLVEKPVVVPNIYGIPEIVHHNETGLLFPAKDIEQLAQHLSYLLQHPEERERLGNNARQVTRQLFDANLMVQQIEAIYDRVLADIKNKR